MLGVAYQMFLCALCFEYLITWVTEETTHLWLAMCIIYLDFS